MIFASPPTPPPPFVVGEQLACASVHPGRKLDVVVGRIDDLGNGVEVVSVSVHDRTPGAAVPGAAHLPFAEAALAASCRLPVAVGVVPDAEFASGYETWRSAFETGRGGYWTLGVEASLDAMATVLRGTPFKISPSAPDHSR